MLVIAFQLALAGYPVQNHDLMACGQLGEAYLMRELASECSLELLGSVDQWIRDQEKATPDDTDFCSAAAKSFVPIKIAKDGGKAVACGIVRESLRQSGWLE